MSDSFPQRILGLTGAVLRVARDGMADPVSRLALGLNPDVAAPPDVGEAELLRLDRYQQLADPTAQDYLNAIRDVSSVLTAMADLAAKLRFAGDTTPFVEFVDFAVELLGLDYVRRKQPTLYRIGQMLGFITENLGLSAGTQKVSWRGLKNLVAPPGGYFKALKDAYVNAPEQTQVDIMLPPVLGLLAGLQYLGNKTLANKPFFQGLFPASMDFFYGWDSLPAPEGKPLGPAESLLEKSLSVALRRRDPAQDCDPTHQFLTCPPPGTPVSSLEVLLDLVAATKGTGVTDPGLFASLRLDQPFSFEIRNAGTVTLAVTSGSFDVFLAPDNKSQLLPGAGGLALGFTPLAGQPTVLVGRAGSTRLEIGRLTLRAEVRHSGGDDFNYALRLAAEKVTFALVIGEGDGFLHSTLGKVSAGGELKLSFDLAVGVGKVEGFFLEGAPLGALAIPASLTSSPPAGTPPDPGPLKPSASGPRVTFPVNKQLGGLRVDNFVAGIDAKEDAAGKLRVSIELRANLSLKTSGLALNVDQVGISWQIKPPGPMGFRPPKGLGISLDLPPVSGGGYLFFDEDNGFYAGAVHLAFGDQLAINGVGIVQTFTTPEGKQDYAFVVVLGLEFTPIQLGFGFTLNGVGGLFGQNRGVNVEALQSGLKTGALQAVLFPQNPVENAPRIISVLSSVFPVTPGQTIFGPALKIGWGTPTIIEAQLGLIVEFESPRRLILVGKTIMKLPKSDPVMHLEFDMLGVFNPSTGESSFDASLYDSKVGPYTVTGDILWRSAGGGRPFWILAVGGTNPHFEVPNGLLPRLERIRINLTNGNNPRAVLQGYAAVTSNTFQVGGAIDASLSAAGFTLVGHLGIDALINTSNFTFIVDFSASVALRRGSTNIASLSLEGTITGPRPFHVDATASISFFLFSIDFHVSFSIGEDAPPPLPATSAARGLLTAALTDLRNWSGDLPARTPMLVSLRKATFGPANATTPDLVVHPLGEVAVRQRVLPLETDLQRLGGQAIAGDRRFSAVNAKLGPNVVDAKVPVVSDFFALADYLDLSDDQKLSRPAFETLKSGQAFTSDHLAPGDGESVTLGYKTIIKRIGAGTKQGARYAPTLEKFKAAVLQGAAAQSPLRNTGALKFAGPSQTFAQRAPLYTVVSTLDMKLAAGLSDDVKTGTTYVQAAQALGRLRQPAGKLQVVTIEEVQP